MSGSEWVSPAGIFARSTDGKATAQNLAGGEVDTHGKAAYGVFARSNNGRAQAENLGTVTTHADHTASVTLPAGDAPAGALGVFAWSDIGDATAENGAANNDAAAVTTAGPGAIGLMAMNNNDGDTRASTVTANNYGSVTTTGANAEGVVALALHGGSSTDSNTVQALNGVGASISTGGTAGSGDGSGGLSASILVTGGGTAYGSASVENRGRITTTGARSSASALDNAFGISAHYYNTDNVRIDEAGDVTAKNIGGEITVSGPGARGIQAITYGSGVATVIADGGTVTASYKDSGSTNAGTGIFASSGGSAGTVDVDILNGATIDAQNAIFIRNAAADIMVSGGSQVIGDVDILNQRDDSMTVDGSTVRGRIQLAVGADTLTVRNGGKIEGAIWFGLDQDELIVENGGTFDESVNFGSESDTLRVNSGNARFNGELQFLDVFEGIGGWIQLRDDVIFLGNSEGDVEQGSPGSATFGSTDGSTAQVSIYGDFNLGESGTMTIHDGSRVQLVASLDDMGELVLPTIDAGGREDEGVRGITCLDSEGAVTGCTLYVQNDEGGGGAGVQQLNQGGAMATAEQLVGKALSDRTTLSGDDIRYKTQTADGEDTVATAIVENGKQLTPTFLSGAPSEIGPPRDPDEPPGDQPTPEDPPGDQPTTRRPAGRSAHTRRPAGRSAHTRRPAGRSAHTRRPAGRSAHTRGPAGRSARIR